MSLSSPTYTMEDLTTAAGVTARTVRYYIAEGLLPPPDGAGPATAYTDAHRNRLLLIGLLKDAYLPLKEIRRRLAAMSEDEIAEAVAVAGHQRLPSPEDASAPERPQPTPAPSSAAAYIDRVLGDQRLTSRRGTRGSQPQPASPRPTALPAPIPRRDHADAVATNVAATAPTTTTTWRRLPIAPEAELLIEENAYRRRQEQVDAALDWLRRILNGS